MADGPMGCGVLQQGEKVELVVNPPGASRVLQVLMEPAYAEGLAFALLQAASKARTARYEEVTSA